MRETNMVNVLYVFDREEFALSYLCVSAELILVCVDGTPLIYASANGHLSTVRHLVEHKANIEAKSKCGMCFRFRFRNYV